jgi:hypothetical protein
MTPSQSTTHADARPDPSRWPRDQRGRACDHFTDRDSFSQREYARRYGIPRSTLGDWLRQDEPEGLDPELVAFLRSAAGERWQRRLVLALLLVFHLDNACGLRQLTRWLAFTQLDRFVASSYGALYDLAARLQADLGRFGDEERQRLGSAMLAQSITLCCDEHFHGRRPCLVAIEPVSNFLVVEGYRERRDGQTWKEAIDAGLRGLPVQVLQLTSDQAKGLLRCARDGFTAAHSPDVFHLQRDVSRPLLLPLARPVQQAHKDLDKAKEQSQRLEALHKAEREEGQQGPTACLERIIESVRDELRAEQRLRAGQQLQEQAHQEVRGLADDYHPFDPQTGRPVTAPEVEQRLRQRLGNLEGVADQADLAQRATEGVAKAYGWVGLLSACVAWFWLLTRQRVAALDLCDAAERLVYDCLVPSYYWEAAARRGRDKGERQRLKELAARLRQEAWSPGGALASLPQEDQERVAQVARQCAGLFQRSSSCVEGRNGRLSLLQHGHGRLNAARLKALTTLHNYLEKRSDGRTAAERFFGRQPRDVFNWLLERLPELPRPAAKRPPKGEKQAEEAA